MCEITFSETISAPPHVVWGVIVNADDYPEWNTFVVACNSSFEVGSPITMKVRVLPFIAMPQKETVRQNREGEFLEYGIKIPFGMLASSRQHRLSAMDEGTTRYESVFVLSGWLAPVVRVLLGAQLRRGFADMTAGVVSRSQAVHAAHQP